MSEGEPSPEQGEPTTTPPLNVVEPATPLNVVEPATALPPPRFAESPAAVEPRRETVPDAPSRREVASAFETWREESRPAPAGVEGPEPPEGGGGFDARAAVDEPPTRGGEGAAGEAMAGAGTAGGAGVVESKRRRAGAVVKENIMPRVGRMRDEALVVLEETPDDAGLRFVIIAAALFLLFLLFLFLSTTIK